MKKLNLAALLALAGAGFATQSAQALSYNPGDIFLGFRNTRAGVTQDYVVDVGSVSLYNHMDGATFTLSIGGTGADLASIFDSFQASGKNWYTGNLTRWGAIGDSLSGDPSNTIYAGKVENPLGTYPTDVTQGGSNTTYYTDTTGNQGVVIGNEHTMGNFYASNGSATGNSTVATFQTAANASSWATKVASPSFGRFSGFEATINSGTGAGTAVDLFKMVPDNVTQGTLTPAYLGRFVIDSGGAINYTAARTEPSTLTALAGGLGLFGFLRRRRAVTA